MDDQRLFELANTFLRDSRPDSLQYLERYRAVIVHLVNAGQSLKQVHAFLSMPEIGITCRYESLRRWVKKNIDLHPGTAPESMNLMAPAQVLRPSTVDKTVDNKIGNGSEAGNPTAQPAVEFPEDPMDTIAKLRKQAADQKAAALTTPTGGNT